MQSDRVAFGVPNDGNPPWLTDVELRLQDLPARFLHAAQDCVELPLAAQVDAGAICGGLVTLAGWYEISADAAHPFHGEEPKLLTHVFGYLDLFAQDLRVELHGPVKIQGWHVEPSNSVFHAP